MVEFEILASGSFKPAETIVFYQPDSAMRQDADTKKWMDDVWRGNLAQAKRKGVPLYDGRLFRLLSFEVEAGGLILQLGDTTYKEYVATRNPEFSQRHSREELANPLAVCAAVVASDGKILVERRQALDVYAGRYHVIGGFFERDKDCLDRPDPAEAIRREVREEIGLAIPRERFECLGLVYDLATPHPELCYQVAADVPFAEIARLRGADGEIKQLECVVDSAEALREFVLRHHGNVSATGEPCLLLYGKSRFGQEWFDDLLVRIS